MIYKVYYQENKNEVPVRELTKALYVKANKDLDIRQKLQSQPIHIEFIQPLEGAYLEYEKQHQNFELTEL